MTARHVRHCKKDALDQREFQLLLEGAQRMRDRWGFQARFCILVTGRLGLRRGELAHMTQKWVDNRRNMIVIPVHDECTKGDNGGICGDCRQCAEQRVEHNPDMKIDEALDLAWMAKTESPFFVQLKITDSDGNILGLGRRHVNENSNITMSAEAVGWFTSSDTIKAEVKQDSGNSKTINRRYAWFDAMRTW